MTLRNQFLQEIAKLDDALDGSRLADDVADIVEKMIGEERERCATVAENWGPAPPNPRGRRAQLAAEIRESK